VLTGPKGRYEGNFKDGLKDGQGTFYFTNGSKYQGSYHEGIKEGHGTIYLNNNAIAYCGNMHNGLPEGDGWIPGEKGEPTYMKFEQGISTLYLNNAVKAEDEGS
jgi:antitoxin component YwqK of YwqJK toxin-antitoxin module